jgi:hypothetical protein
MTKQLLFISLTTTLVLATVSMAHASGRGPCSQDRFDTRPAMGSTVVARRNAALVRCAVRRWSVPGGADKAVSVFRCESSLWSWAHSNGNLGVAQQRDTYWRGRARSYLRRAWFNDRQWHRVLTVPGGAYLGRANVLVSIRQAHRGGWGPWSCA